MFDPDVSILVLEALAKSKRPLSMEEVKEKVPLDSRSVGGVVLAMVNCAFLQKDEQERLSINPTVTAYMLVKLGEIGLSLFELKRLVKISDRQAQAALALADQADKLAQMELEEREKRLASTRVKQKLNLPRDAVVETLELIAAASQMSIEAMKDSSGASGDVVAALFEAQRQAQKALSEYQEQLGGNGGGNVGF